MAFVNEKDKNRTIDYERNVTLTYSGSKHADGHMYTFFELRWNDLAIAMSAIIEMNVIDDKRDINWNLLTISCHPSPSKSQKEIQDLVQEALEAYGYLYTHEKLNNVTIAYDKNYKFK